MIKLSQAQLRRRFAAILSYNYKVDGFGFGKGWAETKEEVLKRFPLTEFAFRLRKGKVCCFRKVKIKEIKLPF